MSTSRQDTTDAPRNQDGARLVVGIVSALLLLAFTATGIIVDEGRGQAPARVNVASISVDTIGSDTHVATVEVENVGDITAQDILLRVEVEGEDPFDRDVQFLAPAETADVTFVVPDGTSESDIDADVKAWSGAR